MALPQTNITAFDGMVPPDRRDPANFNDRAENAWDRLGQGAPQMNVLAGQVNNMATAANTSATAAAASASAAQGFRDEAQSARGSAQAAAQASLVARDDARTARDAAQNYAAALRGTSVQSLVIGTGSKSLTTETGRQFAAGMTVKLVVTTNTSSYMIGTVTSYNSTTGALVVNVTSVAAAFAGTTSNSWNILLSGEQGVAGPTGGVTGGNLTGALNAKRAPDVPIAATMDIWSGAGDYVGCTTGAAQIVNFTAAPQFGARRTLLIGASVQLASNANIYVVGGTQNLVAGDEVDVIADYANHFRAYVRKVDGTPVFASQYLQAQDLQPTGTAGQSIPLQVATQRNLGTLLLSTITGASLASNRVTLPAGTYDVFATANTRVVTASSQRLSLYNVTDSTVAILGENSSLESQSSDKLMARGRIVITAAKVFELQQYGNATASGGLTTNQTGYMEMFANLEIRKVG